MKTKIMFLMMMFLFSVSAFAGVKAFNTAGTELGTFAEVQCGTGMTCTMVSGRLRLVSDAISLSGDITLASSEVIDNDTDDTVDFQSNDEAIIVRATGFEGKAAALVLCADQCDDVADKFTLSASTTNVLSILNGVTTLYQISSTGTLTLPDSESLINSGDTLRLYGDDAATGFGVVGADESTAYIDIMADRDDNATDSWRFMATLSGTLTLANDSTTPGTFVTKATWTGSNGNLALVGDLSGDGGDQLVGFLQNQRASTTAALTAAECGTTVVYDSADVMTLPEASTVLGCRYTFVVNSVANCDVNPADATDKILLLTDAGGDAIRADALGESVTIEAIGNDSWAPVGAEKGTWSDVN